MNSDQEKKQEYDGDLFMIRSIKMRTRKTEQEIARKWFIESSIRNQNNFSDTYVTGEFDKDQHSTQTLAKECEKKA